MASLFPGFAGGHIPTEAHHHINDRFEQLYAAHTARLLGYQGYQNGQTPGYGLAPPPALESQATPSPAGFHAHHPIKQATAESFVDEDTEIAMATSPVRGEPMLPAQSYTPRAGIFMRHSSLEHIGHFESEEEPATHALTPQPAFDFHGSLAAHLPRSDKKVKRFVIEYEDGELDTVVPSDSAMETVDLAPSTNNSAQTQQSKKRKRDSDSKKDKSAQSKRQKTAESTPAPEPAKATESLSDQSEEEEEEPDTHVPAWGTRSSVRKTSDEVGSSRFPEKPKVPIKSLQKPAQTPKKETKEEKKPPAKTAQPKEAKKSPEKPAQKPKKESKETKESKKAPEKPVQTNEAKKSSEKPAPPKAATKSPEKSAQKPKKDATAEKEAKKSSEKPEKKEVKKKDNNEKKSAAVKKEPHPKSAPNPPKASTTSKGATGSIEESTDTAPMVKKVQKQYERPGNPLSSTFAPVCWSRPHRNCKVLPNRPNSFEQFDWGGLAKRIQRSRTQRQILPHNKHTKIEGDNLCIPKLLESELARSGDHLWSPLGVGLISDTGSILILNGPENQDLTTFLRVVSIKNHKKYRRKFRKFTVLRPRNRNEAGYGHELLGPMLYDLISVHNRLVSAHPVYLGTAKRKFLEKVLPQSEEEARAQAGIVWPQLPQEKAEAYCIQLKAKLTRDESGKSHRLISFERTQ